MPRLDRNLESLAVAVEELGHARTPVDELTAARRVRELADEVELGFVAAARDRGLTWADIGAVYGLTKQGAQQRFRAAITPELQRLKRHAGTHARDSGHRRRKG